MVYYNNNMCIWGCQLFVAFKRVTARSMLEYEITVCVSFLNLNSLLHVPLRIL